MRVGGGLLRKSALQWYPVMVQYAEATWGLQRGKKAAQQRLWLRPVEGGQRDVLSRADGNNGPPQRSEGV